MKKTADEILFFYIGNHISGISKTWKMSKL